MTSFIEMLSLKVTAHYSSGTVNSAVVPHTMRVVHTAPASTLGKEQLRSLYTAIAKEMEWELLSLQLEVLSALALERVGQLRPPEKAAVIPFAELASKRHSIYGSDP